jgi:acetyl esterase/lipase
MSETLEESFEMGRQNLANAKNAIRFLRVHAAEYHIDPVHIAVFGCSAGGYFALMVGFTSGEAGLETAGPYPGISSAVSAVGDFYGPFDWELDPKAKMRLSTLPAATLAELRSLEPVTHVSATSPPTLILQGRDDVLVSYQQSVALGLMLTAKGVPHELILLDHVGHGFDLNTWYGHPLPRDLRPVVLAFLAKYLGPPTHSTQTADR